MRPLGPVLALLAVMMASAASAQPAPVTPAASPPPPPAPAPNPALAEAKRLFREGNALREAGDCEGALVRFRASRALVESVPNVMNAAVCLRELGRFDEALEHYEDLVARFSPQLTAGERRAIGPAMKRLAARVGSVDVRANVTRGVLLVDGRQRGTVPLARLPRVLPGRRVVRVLRDGYAPFDATIDVRAGATTRVEATLRPLDVAGRLRIGDAALAGAHVIVDGARVGRVPFDGTLGVGRHWVAVERGDFGTAPMEVTIVKGQIASLDLTLVALGPTWRVEASPSSATLILGDVTLGQGHFEGRLPRGVHRLRVAEPGYLPHDAPLTVTAAGPTRSAVQLNVDDEHPRWGRRAEGLFSVEALGALGLAPSLGSGAEDSCATLACGENAIALGGLVGARVGYEFPFRLSLAVSGGYVRLQKDVARRFSVTQSFVLAPPEEPVALTGAFALDDTLVFSGPFAGVDVGYRQPLGGPFEFSGRVMLGVVFANMRHTVQATVSSEGTSAPVVVAGGDDTRAIDVIVMPELRLGGRWGGFHAGLGLGVALLALEGPANTHSAAQPRPVVDCAQSPDAGCFQGQAVTRGERAFGTFVTALPNVHAGYSF